MKNKLIIKFLYHYLFPYGGLFLVKILSLTYRIKILHSENENDTLHDTQSLVYASWHQRFFPGITFFSSRKPIAIIISRSRDGEFISRIVTILGWKPVRGSSTKGGEKALRKLKQLARNKYRIGHIVDGPRGPFGVVKPGLLRIAQVAEIPIVPTIISPQKKWVFNSWDRFMVPWPFSRIIIRFGSPIHVPADIHGNAFEKQRVSIEEKMKELYEETDLIWRQ